jgi:hypothetical protein
VSSLRWHYPDQVRRSKTLVFLSVWFTQTPVLITSLSSEGIFASKVRLATWPKTKREYPCAYGAW